MSTDFLPFSSKCRLWHREFAREDIGLALRLNREFSGVSPVFVGVKQQMAEFVRRGEDPAFYRDPNAGCLPLPPVPCHEPQRPYPPGHAASGGGEPRQLAARAGGGARRPGPDATQTRLPGLGADGLAAGVTTITSRELNQDVASAKKAAKSGPVVITVRPNGYES